MKKYIYLTALLFSTLFLSGCIVISDDFSFYHDFTIKNDSNTKIEDWYLKSYSGKKVAKSDDWEPVSPHSKSTITDVHENYYRVYFSKSDDPRQYYYSNNYFYLDSDTTYYITTDDFYSRSAIASSNTNTSKEIYLVDDKGNKIELDIEEL